MEDPALPEHAILCNSPALHALKRTQLVRLSKQFGLRANGKNVELIERLKQHGKHLAASVDHDESVSGDASSNWSLVSHGGVPRPSDLEEFGIQQTTTTTMTTSSSNASSLASTIRSARTAVFIKLAAGTSFGTGTKTPSIYPSLADAFERYPVSAPSTPAAEQGRHDAHEATLEEFDHSVEGAIRRVTTRTTVGDDDRDDEVEEDVESTAGVSAVSHPPPAPAFIFGSPPPVAGTTTPQFEFSMTMPGSLLSLSTSSSTSAVDSRGSILEEMNRRAYQSRVEAERRGGVGSNLARSGSSSLLATKAFGARSPEKKTKTELVFEGKHKRAFDKMDSIANHYAAKRPLDSNLSSSRTLDKSTRTTTTTTTANGERAQKRVKSSSTSPGNLVSALRESGWMSAPRTNETVSLKSSIRGGIAAATDRGDGNTKDGLPFDGERVDRKRKLELAKARRKSGVSAAASDAGKRRRRPSTIVGPKHHAASLSSSFLKSTFKRLTSTSATAAQPPATPAVAPIPRFAVATASSASRIVASSSTRTLASPIKKVGVPGWKKFDLQASLKRPMTWKARLGPSASLGRSSSSASILSPPAALARQSSVRVEANPSPRGDDPAAMTSSTSRRVEQAVVSKLAALPSAPTTPFTNVSNTAGSVKAKGGANPAIGRKHVSSATKRARSGKPHGAIEGLESKARKIRAVNKGTGVRSSSSK